MKKIEEDIRRYVVLTTKIEDITSACKKAAGLLSSIFSYLLLSFFISLFFTRAQAQDSLKTRWRIQPTIPLTVADLDSSALDLRMPENIRQTVEYDDSLNVYYIGMKMGDSYLNAPLLMTPEEYRKWVEKRALCRFFPQKNEENIN